MLDALGTVSLRETIVQFCKDRSIPQYVMLSDGDNELLINTLNITSMTMLLETVKKRARFHLKEFLHSEKGCVQGEDGGYANQIILSFYNKNLLEAQD